MWRKKERLQASQPQIRPGGSSNASAPHFCQSSAPSLASSAPPVLPHLPPKSRDVGASIYSQLTDVETETQRSSRSAGSKLVASEGQGLGRIAGWLAIQGISVHRVFSEHWAPQKDQEEGGGRGKGSWGLERRQGKEDQASVSCDLVDSQDFSSLGSRQEAMAGCGEWVSQRRSQKAVQHWGPLFDS